jgi:phage-related protein
MEWTIKIYKTKDDDSPVEEWLKTIPKTAYAKLIRNMKLLREFNIILKEPYVKPLGDKLYEIRAKDTNGIYRVVYFAYTGKKFIMLHGFTKKTQKTPMKELRLSKNRMEEMLNG